MIRLNMLLATIALYALMLSERQQLLVKAHSGSNSYSDIGKSQLHAKQQQQLNKQQQQHFSHHGRHHHQHNQPQQQHHQAISESVGAKLTPTPATTTIAATARLKQHFYKQQHATWNQTQNFGNVWQQFKNKPKDTAEPTSKPTSAIRESQAQEQQRYKTHQQQQQHQQQQHHHHSQHHHQHQQQQDAHPHHQQHHQHYSPAAPTAKPIVATHSSSALSSSSSSFATYAHNHSKTLPLMHSSSHVDVAANSFQGATVPKSMATESRFQHHFKAKTQHNRHEELAARKHHHHQQSKSRIKSLDLNYASDYYDDDDDADEDEEDDGEYNDSAEVDDNDRDLDVAGHEEDIEDYVASATGFSDRDEHEYNRVTRDHRYTNRLEEIDRKSDDQDYADDEPYRSSSSEQQQQGGGGDASVAKGVLSEQKFRELGTMEAVQQTRDKYLQEQELLRPKTPADLAREHMNRMKVATKCSRPLPRVVHVSNETSKRYMPYCTILHRCGQDTGCCDSTRQVCAAKRYEDVQVYFFVIKMNSGRTTEVKTMRNHTECHCVDIAASNMQRDKRSHYNLRPAQEAAATNEENHQQQQQQELQQLREDEAAVANDICRCPRHFDVFPDDAESPATAAMHPRNCRCDCLSSNRPCQRLKNGEEGFAVDDRKCIAERNCKAPICAYGDYSRLTGRCPRLRNHKRTITHRNYGFA